MLISLSFLGLFLVLSAVGFVGYRLLQAKRSSQTEQKGANVEDIRANRFAVEHGPVAGAAELHGHGKLYFVPVGRQVIPVQSLADYYSQKFAITITVLPEVAVGPGACVPARNQCFAEDLMAEMANAYPEILRDPGSVMIALTDLDIFPRKLGWDFTYSLHSTRIGIVSTRRMDPAFWGDPSDDAARLARTKQMLTKYVAIQYFHLPESYDPTSVLFSPLTPNGGSDDIYESDLHPEDSANGSRGTTSFPCLYFTFSYKSHEIKPDAPFLSDCAYHNPATSPDEETFETDLRLGQMTQRSMDIRLDSTPPIELNRAFTAYDPPATFALGRGANHSYNPWLSSDGATALTYIAIVREDGVPDLMNRVPPGRGFNPLAVYQGDSDSVYGARLTWDGDHYKLQYRDGAWATFLPCIAPNTRCYWTGYHDAKGNSLQFDRGPGQELLQLTASDNQGISFLSDDQLRTTEARATDGTRVSYEYDEEGCLARVKRTDGQVTLYQYDPAHRMTSISVVSRRGATPETILTNEYDSQGRAIRQTLSGVGSYQIQYLAGTGAYASRLQVTTPEGEVLNVSLEQGSYVVRSPHLRFPALPPR